MLADWLEKRTGLVVPELTHGMVGKRLNAPQPTLFDDDGKEQSA